MKKFTRCYRCGRKTRLFECKHCGNYYCEGHSDPKLPLTPNMVFNEKDPFLSQLYEKEWRKGGHPCVPYGEWKLNEIKENESKIISKVMEALDKAKKVEIKSEETLSKKNKFECAKCGEKNNIQSCKHCKNHFCEEHISPKLPLTPDLVFNEKDPLLARIYEEEWRKEGGHSCPPYGEMRLNQLKGEYKESTERLMEALDRMKEVQMKRSTYFPSFKPFERPSKRLPRDIKTPRRIPTKTIIAIAVFIIVELYIYYNFGTVSKVINNMLLVFQSKPKCETNFITAYESTASFGKDPFTYCKNICKEKYNSTVYNVSEQPNGTNTITSCFCDVNNCSISTESLKTEKETSIPINPPSYETTYPKSNYQTTGYVGCSVIQIQYNYYSSEQDSRNAIEYLNTIREKNGKNKIAFDSRLYKLAVVRAKDMRENNYLDHVNPVTGKCAENMKYDFNLTATDIIAENAMGNPQYSEGSCTEIEMKSMNEVIDGWMTSRGHRYNLLYDEHVAGAIGCYKNMCIFLGMHHNPYGLGGGGECHTAAEGIAFWNSATPQSGEVSP